MGDLHIAAKVNQNGLCSAVFSSHSAISCQNTRDERYCQYHVAIGLPSEVLDRMAGILGIYSCEMRQYMVDLNFAPTGCYVNCWSCLHGAMSPTHFHLSWLPPTSSLSEAAMTEQTMTNLRIGHHCQYRIRSSEHYSSCQNAYFIQAADSLHVTYIGYSPACIPA